MVKTIITAAIATAALVGCATPYQVMADREVDRLCAVDGGVTVFEKAQLSPEDYGPDGKPIPRTPQHRIPGQVAAFGINYTKDFSVSTVTKEPVLIEKLTFAIRRKTDQTVLGRKIYYQRHGGDAFDFYHPTNYSCPADGTTPALETAVFGNGGRP